MRFAFLGAAMLLIAGCGQPRSRDDIFTERARLPQVYMGLKTGKQIVASASKGVFTDPETKDEFWPAMECTNPDCPNRRDKEPSLFVLPRSEVQRGCPHCLKNRSLKKESAEEKAKYESFVRPYVLPETVARSKELDDEFQRAMQRDGKNRREP